MHQITIRLPCNRDYAGTLKLEDAKGKLIAGPFKICARAHDELAQANGNPGRLPVLPFGDMPLGEYQITQIIPSGPGTPYESDEFGSAGIVFLQPRHGEAVLADANGRFIFLIQGGALSRNGALRPTQDGSLRLSNRDQRKLVSILRRVGVVTCRCIVTNSGSAKHRVAAASSARSKRAPARDAAAAALSETSRRSWLRTMLIAAGAFASVPSLLLFSPSKAYGEGGGTDYSPTNQPTNDQEKYQQQLNDAREAADKAKADYEKEKESNPNANMAPMLDAQGKVQGLENMVKYEQQQAAQQTPPATTTEPTNETPTNTTTATETNNEAPTNTTTTEPTNENPQNTTTTTGTNNENPTNTTTTVSEPTYVNPQNTTTEPTNETPANTTTTTEPTNENPANTTTTGTETINETPQNTTTTEPANESPQNTTTTTTEPTNENPANSQTMTVSEPTYNNGADTQPQPNPEQPGTETDLRDAPNSNKNPNQPQSGQLTPFNNPPQPAIDQTPVQKPSSGSDFSPSHQLGGVGKDTNETAPEAQIGFDTAGKKNTSTFTFVSPPRNPAGTEPPLNVPESMKNDPDVKNLSKYQLQLKQDQAAADKAKADWQKDPNGNMTPMLDAQAKAKATQDMIDYEKKQVKAKLPSLPTAPPAGTKQKP
jgi:hypothetical protein